jgi:ammonia channel protein AmtB
VSAPAGTVVLLFAIKAVIATLRVTDEEEVQAVDLTELSETAYTGH